MVPACGAVYLLDKFGVSAGGADYLLVTSMTFMPIADYFLGISTAPTYEAYNCWSSLTAPRVCFDCLLGAFTISAYGAVCSFGSFMTSTFGADYLLDKFAVCTCGADLLVTSTAFMPIADHFLVNFTASTYGRD